MVVTSRINVVQLRGNGHMGRQPMDRQSIRLFSEISIRRLVCETHVRGWWTIDSPHSKVIFIWCTPFVPRSSKYNLHAGLNKTSVEINQRLQLVWFCTTAVNFHGDAGADKSAEWPDSIHCDYKKFWRRSELLLVTVFTGPFRYRIQYSLRWMDLCSCATFSRWQSSSAGEYSPGLPLLLVVSMWERRHLGTITKKSSFFYRARW